MYMVKRDFWSDWGIRNVSEAIVDMEEIEDSAGRWHMTVDDLLEEVEEMVGGR